MISRRLALFGLAFLPYGAASKPAIARAAFSRPFTMAEFAEAQSAGRSILVEVSADWCPTCRFQEEVLERVRPHQDLWQMLHLVVDYDTQPDVMRLLRAQKQATLIVYKGFKEMGRSVGDTNEGRIARLLRAGL